MPYLGNTPSTSFATVVKDSFNGGSTAYTLSKVATTNSVSVFVENVRQEPTSAYSVSGTTLTFTATTPSGTGNIYVLHMNPTTTTTHPAAQNLTAVDGTFTGNIDVDGTANLDVVDIDGAVDMASTLAVTGATTLSGGVSGDLTVDSGVLAVDATNNKIRYTQGTNKGLVIQDAGIADTTEINFGTSGEGIRAGLITGSNLSFYTGTAGGGSASKKMEIDTSGRVMKPSQPGFMIGLSGGHITSGGNTVIFNNSYFNEGSHYNTSTGVFTAPVAGTYIFHAFLLLQNDRSIGDYYWSFTYNGSALAYCYQNNFVANKHVHYSNAIIYKMSASDTMQVYNHNATWYGISALHGQFHGYLLG